MNANSAAIVPPVPTIQPMPLFSKEVMNALESMSSFLDPKALRTYAEVIGIRAGMACVTDGFGLLVYRDPSLDGLEPLSLDHRFQPSPIKFPSFEALLPDVRRSTETRVYLDETIGQDVLHLARSVKVPKAREPALYLRVWRDEVSIVPRAEGVGTFFRPAVLQTFAKLLPKGVVLQTVSIVDDTHLVLTFEPAFTLLCAAVQAEDAKS